MSPTGNSFVKRWLTGIIIVPVLLLVIFWGSKELFAALVIFFTLGGVWEYNNIVFEKGFSIEKTESLLLAIILPSLALTGNSQYVVATLAFSVIVIFILFIFSIKQAEFDVLNVAKVIFGIMYIPFLTSYFILLRTMEKGALWIVFVLVLAFIGDIAALYVGKYFGKHKLVPLISPGKTMEGLIALVLSSTTACLLFAYFFFPEISLIKIAVLAFIGSIIGQLGDICESAIKRSYGLKDASSFLPGHGGILDRLDCLIFIAPFVYYFRIMIIG